MPSFENDHRSPTPYSPLHAGTGPDAHQLLAVHIDNKRGEHPRACRFRDLGEAHRNITGRSISGACSAGGGQGGLMTRSLSGSTGTGTDDAGRVSPRRNVTSPVTFGATACVTPLRNKTSPGPVRMEVEEKNDEGANAKFDNYDNYDNIFGVCPSSSPPPANNQRSSGFSQMALTVDSKDTTVRMYRQYQELILSQPSPSPVPVLRSTIYRRRDDDDDDDDVAESPPPPPPGAAAHDSPASDPTPSLFDIGSQLDDSSSPTHRGAKTQSLAMSVPTRESLLYPKPLRVQSIRAEGKHASLYSGAAVSGTGMTTDSEDDPFRYDKDAYKIFLHPSKERDVSAALNHIGGSVNSHSRATLLLQQGGGGTKVPAAVHRRQPTLDMSQQYGDDDPFCAGPTRARSVTPEDAEGFYDRSVIQPSWAGSRSEYEVKVVLQDVRHKNVSVDVKPPPPSKFHRASLFNKSAQQGRRDKRDKENAVPSSECGDWETVATTSVPGLGGSMQLPRRRGLGINTTMGSSVADVSDSDSFSHVPFNEYASTDRIVQHASGHEDSEESLQMRSVGGTKVPVMIAKQRVHRVNGCVLPQPPQAPQEASAAAAAFARRVSSPFRQLSDRRSRQFSPTPLLQPLPYKLDKGRGKFEFQHQSFQASDGASYGSKPVYEFKGVSSDTNNNTTTTMGDDSHSLRDSGSSQSSHRTMHSFPFPLIPLPQAARMEAVRRQTAHGYVDDFSRAYWDASDANKTRVAVTTQQNRDRDRRSFHRSPTAFFASLFSPSASTTQSSCYHAQRYSRLKKSRAIANDLTVASTVDDTASASGIRADPGGSTWASLFPLGPGGSPSHLLRSAATKLHLNDLGRKLYSPGRPAGGIRILSRSNTPRLYPWDYPMRCEREREREERRTDPELQAIALPGRPMHMHADLEWTGVPQDPEAFLSRDVRQQRQVWFYCVLAASAFPFISVLVYMGKFDSALSWFTRGEVSRLNGGQRRAIFLVMIMQFVLWPIALGVVIWQTV